MSCPATLMMNRQVHPCDWPAPHQGHAHHNHEAGATWTTVDDDVLQADLDAAQDEIERLTRQLKSARDIAVRSGYFQNDVDEVVA